MGYEFDPWSENWEPTCHEANSAACCNCWAQAPKWKILPDAGRILCASTKTRCSHIRKKKKKEWKHLLWAYHQRPSPALTALLETFSVFGELIWVQQGYLAHSHPASAAKEISKERAWWRPYTQMSSLSEVREDTGKLPDTPSKKTSLPESASFRLCTQKFPHPCCFHCHCFWKKEHCFSLPGSLHNH